MSVILGPPLIQVKPHLGGERPAGKPGRPATTTGKSRESEKERKKKGKCDSLHLYEGKSRCYLSPIFVKWEACLSLWLASNVRDSLVDSGTNPWACVCVLLLPQRSCLLSMTQCTRPCACYSVAGPRNRVSGRPRSFSPPPPPPPGRLTAAHLPPISPS